MSSVCLVYYFYLYGCFLALNFVLFFFFPKLPQQKQHSAKRVKRSESLLAEDTRWQRKTNYFSFQSLYRRLYLLAVNGISALPRRFNIMFSICLGAELIARLLWLPRRTHTHLTPGSWCVLACLSSGMLHLAFLALNPVFLVLIFSRAVSEILPYTSSLWTAAMGRSQVRGVPVPARDAWFKINGRREKSTQLPAFDFILNSSARRQNMNWKGCEKMVTANVKTSFIACLAPPAWSFGLVSAKGLSLIFSFSWAQSVSEWAHESLLFGLESCMCWNSVNCWIGVRGACRVSHACRAGRPLSPSALASTQRLLDDLPGVQAVLQATALKAANLILVCKQELCWCEAVVEAESKGNSSTEVRCFCYSHSYLAIFQLRFYYALLPNEVSLHTPRYPPNRWMLLGAVSLSLLSRHQNLIINVPDNIVLVLNLCLV